MCNWTGEVFCGSKKILGVFFAAFLGDFWGLFGFFCPFSAPPFVSPFLGCPFLAGCLFFSVPFSHFSPSFCVYVCGWVGGCFFWGEGAFFWALFLWPPFFPSFPFFLRGGGAFFWALLFCPFLGGRGLFFRGLLFVDLLSVCWGDPGPVDLSKARNQEARHDHWLVTTADTVSDQDEGGEAQLSHRLQPKKTLRPDTREGTETRHTITHPITQINSQRIFLCTECPV